MRSSQEVSHEENLSSMWSAGHFVRNCPQQHRGEQDRLLAEQFDERGQSSLSSSMCHKAPGVSTAVAVYLDLHINGRKCECLLDTGTDVTVT